MSDAAVLRRLLAHVGADAGPIHQAFSKSKLLRQLPNYNRAARVALWIVIVDLDTNYDCAVAAKEAWLPEPAPQMCFRIAVREVESWLLGDAERIAGFLGISPNIVPRAPESLDDPKRKMIDLARRSSKKEIVKEMVPRDSSGKSEGPAYASRLAEFAADYWRPEIAAATCESVQRCLDCLRRLIAQADPDGGGG
jgi:hypothetical protein